MVFSGLVTACRLATCPARRSPLFVKPTTEGVVRPPSWLGMTTGWPPSIAATTELVVPKSIPMILLILKCPLFRLGRRHKTERTAGRLRCEHAVATHAIH